MPDVMSRWQEAVSRLAAGRRQRVRDQQAAETRAAEMAFQMQLRDEDRAARSDEGALNRMISAFNQVAPEAAVLASTNPAAAKELQANPSLALSGRTEHANRQLPRSITAPERLGPVSEEISVGMDPGIRPLEAAGQPLRPMRALIARPEALIGGGAARPGGGTYGEQIYQGPELAAPGSTTGALADLFGRMEANRGAAADADWNKFTQREGYKAGLRAAEKAGDREFQAEQKARDRSYQRGEKMQDRALAVYLAELADRRARDLARMRENGRLDTKTSSRLNRALDQVDKDLWMAEARLRGAGPEKAIEELVRLNLIERGKLPEKPSEVDVIKELRRSAAGRKQTLYKRYGAPMPAWEQFKDEGAADTGPKSTADLVGEELGQ